MFQLHNLQIAWALFYLIRTSECLLLEIQYQYSNHHNHHLMTMLCTFALSHMMKWEIRSLKYSYFTFILQLTNNFLTAFSVPLQVHLYHWAFSSTQLAAFKLFLLRSKKLIRNHSAFTYRCLLPLNFHCYHKFILLLFYTSSKASLRFPLLSLFQM